MNFLKFNNSKNLVSLNRKRLKSLTYKGKTYTFDVDKGNDINIHISNPLNEADVECYKIPTCITYDKVECAEDTFLVYYNLITSVGITSAPLYDDNSSDYVFLINSILSSYVNFKDQNELEGLVGKDLNFKLINRNQSQIYLLSESYNNSTWGDTAPCTYLFYNIKSKCIFNKLNSSGESIWDEYQQELNSIFPTANFPKITDYESYVEVLKLLEPHIINKIKNVTTEEDYNLIATIFQSFGLAGEILKLVFNQIAIRNKPELNNTDTDLSILEILEAVKLNCDDIFDYIYSVYGLEIISISDIQEELDKINTKDQVTEIVVQDLMDELTSLRAKYYYNKKFESINVFKTKHISENLISSDIFYPQTLSESNELLNIKHIKVDISNLFEIPINTSDYNYIPRYPILKIAYIKDLRNKNMCIYRECDYDKMEVIKEIDIPEGCTDINITFATSDLYDESYWVEDLGVTMFADNDTKHQLPNNAGTVPDWKGYRTLKVHNEYTKKRYGFQLNNGDIIGDSNSIVSGAGINYYTIVYIKSDININDATAHIKEVRCLAGDTLILMGDGTLKRLDHIKVGESVMTIKKGKKVPSKVVYCDSDQFKIGFATRYTFESEYGICKYVDVINNHRFFTGNKCEHIDDMKIDDVILGENGVEFYLSEILPLYNMRHYTLFTQNACPYIANGLIAGNIFCNIKPKFISRFMQFIYLKLLSLIERKSK